MGEQEGWPRPPSGVLPNGMLPNEGASVMRVLDSERWLMAEKRTAELISCIQPNTPSEARRNAVADYVKRLVTKCFPCEVFTFGSVPLKTYLPDGDIDLTAFSENQNLKDSWAHHVRDMLEKEEKNENAEFHVKEVQYIQAEVKIIKCLVENIVVDISFNQLGGLCTLCFLDEVDNLIDHDHLFKRSIILIKAWCYYESRILGAHHGLISTYALETLVLYIFHVFNNSFAGPLEVLFRFLEFFSKFDWDNFCVSLWGPVPISSLPDVTAEPPRKDGGDLLLSKMFLDACESVYSVYPGGLENHGQPFVSKHFNVIDPLRVNNNLGRSVSKGNFFRIRSAFAFGAKRLSRLFDCPKEDIFPEVNQFFRNTWERHGSGQRPDAPKNDILCSRLSSPDQPPGFETLRKIRLSQDQKSYCNPNNSRTSEQTRREVISNQEAQVHRVQRGSKADNFVNELQGKFFARTQSSPELTDVYGEVSPQPRHTKAMESGKSQVSSTRVDDGRRKNMESDKIAGHGARIDDSSSVRHISSNVDADDSNSLSNSFHDDSGSGAVGEEFASVTGAHMMNQEEQDLLNIMTSSTAHGFNGQVHFPLGLAPGHVPLPFSPSMLASLGYAQRNMGNIPLIETPWGANVQFPPGLVPSALSHYLPGVGLASNPEDSIESSNGNFSSVEVNPSKSHEVDNDLWHEQGRVSPSGFDMDNVNFEMHHSGDRQQSTSSGDNYITSPRAGNSSNSTRSQQKVSRENRQSMTEDRVDNFQFQDDRGNGVYFDGSAVNPRFFPSASLSSLKSKTSSESSLDGASTQSSKSVREKCGRKNAPLVSSASYGKSKNLSELSSQVDDDKRERNTPSPTVSEVTENSGSESVSQMQVSGYQAAGFEPPQITGSDPLMPMAPVLLGPASRQRSTDNSGVLPYAFYPTGPPVPFVTMLPFYNFPTEAGTSETSTSNFNGEEWIDSSESQNIDALEGINQLKVSNSSDSVRRPTAVDLPEHKPDILNSDFVSHWKNLQYGRFCQNSRHQPIICPTPVVVPPVYLQGHFPWDGPGRPISANMNLVNQLVSYGPHIVPVAPVQSTNRPTSVYQRFADEMPRYRTGTGTYLPNPKPSARDRHSPSNRRGNYSYDRSDHHGDREGTWNGNSKVRSSGRSHNRNQAERQSSRPERVATSESRADRPWGSQRNDTFIAHQTQNGPVRSNSSQSGPSNVAYGMYALPATNLSGLSSNGPPVPSVVMLYPYDHHTGYGSPAEQLEFGSLGPIGFTNLSELSQLNEGNRSSGAFEEHSLHGSSAPRSSPDQPSSPHFSRRL